MADKSNIISLVSHEAEVGSAVLELLEDALKDASETPMRALTLVMIGTDGDITRYYIAQSRLELVGALEFMKVAVMGGEE